VIVLDVPMFTFVNLAVRLYVLLNAILDWVFLDDSN